MRLFLLICILCSACGPINFSSFKKDFCREEKQRIGELNLMLDVELEVLRKNNEDWQRVYDEKDCLCNYQDF